MRNIFGNPKPKAVEKKKTIAAPAPSAPVQKVETREAPVEETADEFSITRVDTLHADVDMSLSAKSGDEFMIDSKPVKVPSGTSGQSFRVKMISTAKAQEEEEPSTGMLCCA